MKTYIYLLLFFNLFTSFTGQTQDTLQTEYLLVLRKTNSSKRVYYHTNSLILFKTKDSVQRGVIRTIYLDSMLIDSTWINYHEITTIINSNGRRFLKEGSIKFPVAGIAFALITTFNSFIQNDKPYFFREHLIPSAGLIGLGVFMLPFRTQKCRLRRKWDLIVMPS